MPQLFKNAKDPISSYTHFLGAIFALCATAWMLTAYSLTGGNDPWVHSSLLLFGFSLLALYTASAVYHYVQSSDAIMTRLRKLDHAMIYVLIAGSYTPFCAKFLDAAARRTFILAIWGVAILGIIVKVLWLNAPRWLYTGIYLLMGWAILFDYDAFATSIPAPCLALIAAGGISYSIGAIIYIVKKPDIFKAFGFHEIFHVLIMLGSAFHIGAVLLYVI